MSAEWNDPPSHLPALMMGEIDVWSITLDLPMAQVEALGAVLSADERDRASRFCFERDRRRYICARRALRALLAGHLGVGAEDVTFRYGSNGKPALSGQFEGRFTFNVSHSGGLALVAISRNVEIGVDVEVVRPLDDAHELASRFFAPREAERLRALPSHAVPSAFFACWTRKEAYLKAIGSGLAKPLDAFEVSFADDETAKLIVYGDEAETARWTVRGLAPAAGYAAALVTEGAAIVRCWRFACQTNIVPVKDLSAQTASPDGRESREPIVPCKLL